MTLVTENKLSHIYNRVIPQYIRETYPGHIEMVKAFFEHIERVDLESDPVDIGEYAKVQNLLRLTDLDETIDQFLNKFQFTYMHDMSEVIKSDLRFILKSIKALYLAKGTEESFRLFFKMIYDADVNIIYPKENILRVSDGKWEAPFLLLIDSATLPFDINSYTEAELEAFTDAYIAPHAPLVGVSSGATGIPENYAVYIGASTPDPVIKLTNVTGTFLPGEAVYPLGVLDPNTAPYMIEVDSTETIAGAWTNNDGKLSSVDIVLQDSYYYQDFSYVLQSTVPISSFLLPVLRMLHPAGFKLFSDLIASGIPEFLGSAGLAASLSYTEWFIKWINELTQTTSLYGGNPVSFEITVDYVPIAATSFVSGNKSLNTTWPGVGDQDANALWTIEDFIDYDVDYFDNAHGNLYAFKNGIKIHVDDYEINREVYTGTTANGLINAGEKFTAAYSKENNLKYPVQVITLTGTPGTHTYLANHPFTSNDTLILFVNGYEATSFGGVSYYSSDSFGNANATGNYIAINMSGAETNAELYRYDSSIVSLGQTITVGVSSNTYTEISVSSTNFDKNWIIFAAGKYISQKDWYRHEATNKLYIRSSVLGGTSKVTIYKTETSWDDVNKSISSTAINNIIVPTQESVYPRISTELIIE